MTPSWRTRTATRCEGLALGERYRKWHLRYPPLVFGPRVESRPVGVWGVESEAEPEDREPWPVIEHDLVISPAALAAREQERELARAAQAGGHDDIPF